MKFGSMLRSVTGRETMDDAYQRCADEIKRIDARGGFNLQRNSQGQILAPNGLVSKFADEEFICKLIRTPSFKRFFGDWEVGSSAHSLVIDHDTGEPRIVFHATPAELPKQGIVPRVLPAGKIEVLGAKGADKYMKTKKTSEAWFSSSARNAMNSAVAETVDDADRTSMTVYPVFLNIRQPRGTVKLGQEDGSILNFPGDAKIVHYVVRTKSQIMHLPFSIKKK